MMTDKPDMAEYFTAQGQLKGGYCYVYPPNSNEGVIKTLANGRDLVNGAGWTWRADDRGSTPAASTPHIGAKAHEPGVEDILKAGAVQDRPKAGDDQAAKAKEEADAKAAAAAAAEAEAKEEADAKADAEAEEKAKAPAPKKSPAPKRPARPTSN